MVMDQINKKMKYIVIICGAFILAGLVLIDRAGNRLIEPSQEMDVLVVDGKPISIAQFQSQVDNQVQQAQRSATPVDGLKRLRIKKDVYDRIVQLGMLTKLKERYGLYASPAEMWANLDQNPLPGVEKDTTFYTKGEFDLQKYQSWLRTSQVLNSRFMRSVEEQLKNEVIPQRQLLVYLGSFIKPNYLEANFNNYTTRISSEYQVYKISNDSITLDSSLTAVTKLQEFYHQNQNQFSFTEDGTSLKYVTFSTQASVNDSLVIAETAQDIFSQIEQGVPFNEMVEYYSDDKNTVAKDGSLGDFRKRGFYVAAFDTVSFNLKKGKISKPFLTRYGWHIVRCDSIKGKGKNKEIKVSHILLKIQVSIETLDSLIEYVSLLQKKLKKQDLESLVAEYPKYFEVFPEVTIERWQFSPIDHEFISGLHSFAFGNSAVGEVSKPLFNEKLTHLYIFQKKEIFQKDKPSYTRSKSEVEKALITLQKQKLAKQKLIKILPKIKKQKIKKLASSVNGAMLSKTKAISPKAWDFEIGYDQVASFSLLTVPVKTWGSVEIVDDGAIVVYPLTRNITSGFLEYHKKNIVPEPFQIIGLGTISLDFFEKEQQDSDIKNKFDIVFNN